MGLKEYRRKRDFAVTAEPRGKDVAKTSGRSFVIQKHAASHLHYDFRLELEGVLKSWAVPKGPSLDPSVKRLAMQTEDHPVEYGGFEGIIPQGEYGGGTVLLWDRGRWEPIGDAHEGYRAGLLKFELHGQKLSGAWMLVKLKKEETKDGRGSWLLVKERDEFARAESELDIVERKPKSVESGRGLEEIAARPERVRSSHRAASREALAPDRAAQATTLAATSGAVKAALPEFLEPQLCTLVTEAPDAAGWLHEMKYDGYRILCRLENGSARLLSRNGKDWTARLAPVARAAESLPCRAAMLDGEVVVVLPSGVTSFNALQNVLSDDTRGELVYIAFDLLHLDGFDLRRLPLELRKRSLEELVAEANPARLRYSEHVEGSGTSFFREACRLGLEGMVSKRRDGPYEAGRGRGWVKVKCGNEQEFVVGGFTDPEGSRIGFGALLLGVHDEAGRLLFVGKVGTGFTEKFATSLRKRLDGMATKECPFEPKPRGFSRVQWVRPELVAQVTFSEWTGDGKLRHPSFKGLREDKPAAVIVREKPSGKAPSEETQVSARKRPLRAADRTKSRAPRAEEVAMVTKKADGVAVAGVTLTHPDRVVYPDQGATKRDLALYYEAVHTWMLPHLVGRPATLVRCPEGLGSPCFYQKHTGFGVPKTVRRISIQEKNKVDEYLVVDDLPGIVGLVQIGILEIHTWNSTADALETPDRIVFDLDPDPTVTFKKVIDTARRLRARMQELGLESFVKTTGGKGLHVVVPFVPELSWDDCAEFSRRIVGELETHRPNEYTTNMSKAKRTGKIFLDYLRNIRGATSVAAYSTRARPAAPVSVPLAWDELTSKLSADTFTMRNVPRRLSRLKADPWARAFTVKQRLAPALESVREESEPTPKKARKR
ncbi:MAG: DNA ligase D [Thermoanaerobaculia bacterium]